MMRERIAEIFSADKTMRREYKVGSVRFGLRELPGDDFFQMGNEEGEKYSDRTERPRHVRRIAPFACTEYLVSQGLWTEVYELAKNRNVMFDENRLQYRSFSSFGANHPVENVSWYDAQEFCRVLNVLMEKRDEYFRLPSEAEWEYAARAGARKTLFSGGNNLAEVGWYNWNTSEVTMPVGLLAPNVFGLYDLSGNVWEWCEDDWQGNHENYPSDGQARINNPNQRGEHRVRRGGSINGYEGTCSCANRFGWKPASRNNDVGFRIVCPVTDSS